MKAMNYDDVELLEVSKSINKSKIYKFSNGWKCHFYIGNDNDYICLEFRKRNRPTIEYILIPKEGKSVESVDFVVRMYELLEMACQADELFDGVDDDFE